MTAEGGEREASPPPLLAYTASRQAQASGKKMAGGKSARGKPGGKQQQATARKFKRQAEPVLFDDKARHEYLTGFRKRKQARIENSKQKAKDRENEERRRMRAEARKARKEQAAENVRMEKVAYGGDEDSEEGDDEEEPRQMSPSAFDTEEHHTTVTVEAWDPNAEHSMVSHPREPKKPVLKEKHQLPPSSRRAAKKAKSEEKAAASAANKNRRSADPRQLSRLMDAEEADLVVAEPKVWDQGNQSSDKKDASKKGKFYYESKLDRAKAKAKIREDKAKFAEKQKEKRKVANILRRGGAKARALMRGEM